MTLLVVGVSHNSAPTALLDSLAAVDSARLASESLASEHIAESMVVSTCNRIEVYAEVDRFHVAVGEISALLAKAAGLPEDEVASHCYVHYDARAIQHIFELAAGLDSIVVGEQQILGQVRAAVVAAQDSGTAGRELNEVGQAALRVGKHVRTVTPIDGAGASIVSVGLAEAFDRLAGLGGAEPREASVVVVGAGAMGSLSVSLLARLGVGNVTVANRNRERAREGLARQPGGDSLRVGGLGDLRGLISAADVVVCCTGSAGIVVPVDLVRTALSGRPGRPLVVLDLAVPHDSDTRIGDLAGVVRLDMSDIAAAARSRSDADAADDARCLVGEELSGFLARRAARAFEPYILSLRARASAVVDAELERVRERLPGVTLVQWEEIEHGFRRAFNSLMHEPTIRIKGLATDPDGATYAQTLSSVFDLSVDLAELEAGGVR